MQLVQRVETFDGQIHDSVSKAKRYLEVVHADKLTIIASALVKLDAKFVATGNWIDEHLDLFADLAEVKADMVLSNPEEDD